MNALTAQGQRRSDMLRQSGASLASLAAARHLASHAAAPGHDRFARDDEHDGTRRTALQEHSDGAPATSGRSRSGERSSLAAVRSSAQSIRQDDSPAVRAVEGSRGHIPAHWPWPSAVGRQGTDVERLDDGGEPEHQHADDGSCCPPCAERARVPAEERRARLERLYAQLQLLEMGGRDAAN